MFCRYSVFTQSFGPIPPGAARVSASAFLKSSCISLATGSKSLRSPSGHFQALHFGPAIEEILPAALGARSATTKARRRTSSLSRRTSAASRRSRSRRSLALGPNDSESKGVRPKDGTCGWPWGYAIWVVDSVDLIACTLRAARQKSHRNDIPDSLTGICRHLHLPPLTQKSGTME